MAPRPFDRCRRGLHVVCGARAAEIGSISKVFTGLLVAQQVEQGRLGLDDTLGTLLEGRVPFRYERVTTIPVRHLLTHRACLPHWPASFTGSQMFEQATKLGREGLWPRWAGTGWVARRLRNEVQQRRLRRALGLRPGFPAARE